MSNKRSQRNTKSFRKARARAGISRQDLRSGGRVSLMEGSVTIGQDDDELTTTETTEETRQSANTATSTSFSLLGADEKEFPILGPYQSDEAAEAERLRKANEAAEAERLRKANEAADKEENQTAFSYGGPESGSINLNLGVNDELNEAADIDATTSTSSSSEDFMSGTDMGSESEEAETLRLANEASAKARKDAEDKKIRQDEQDIKFKEISASDEAKNLEQIAKDVLKDNSAFKDLKVKTQGILNSGMSPEKQQEALNNLAGETQKVMAYALQQPAMQQAVKSLQRRATMGSAQDDPDTAIPTGEDSAAPNAQDEGFFGSVLSSIWGGVVGFVDSPIGTTLSLASSIIGIPGAVMDMMTGMFKKDIGQENVLFRDALNSAYFQDQISDDGRVLDDDPTVINTGFGTTDGTGDSRTNTTVTVDPVTGEVINDETSSDTVHNKPGSDNKNEGDKVEDENRQNPTQPPNNPIRGLLQKSTEQAYNDDGSLALKRGVDTILQKQEFTPEESSENFKAYQQSEGYNRLKYGDDRLSALPARTQSANGQWWPTPQAAAEYDAWLKDQPKKTVLPQGTEIADDKIQRLASESTPEENVASFKAYQKSEGYDPSKYGDGSRMSSPAMTQSADGQWWPSIQAAAEYEAWLQDQPRPPKATAGTVASPADITSTTGEAVTADLPGRTLKPEEQKKRFQDSDAFRNFDKNARYSPAVMAFSSDGQRWPNPGQRDAYEEWLKAAPATESDLETVTYDAATAGDLTDLIAASGTVSRKATASDADLTATTAAQRDAEQETAAKATAAERPGEDVPVEILQERWKNSPEYKEARTESVKRVNAQIRELQAESDEITKEYHSALREGRNILEIDRKSTEIKKKIANLRSNESFVEEGIPEELYNEWAEKQPKITSEYAEGVTSPEEYIINNPDDPQVRERVLSVITEEEIKALRKISQGRVIPVEEVMKRFPDIKKRVVQKGAFASRDARQLGEAPTETEAEADYKEMQAVAAGIKEDIGTIGQAGQSSREGVTSEGIGDMTYAGVDVGRTLKPEEQKKRFQDSDAFKNIPKPRESDEIIALRNRIEVAEKNGYTAQARNLNIQLSRKLSAVPTVMHESSDGQLWPNPEQRDTYEEWLKSAPKNTGSEEAALKSRTAITEELKRLAEEQQTGDLDPFTLERERKAQTGTAASRTESQVTAIADTLPAEAGYKAAEDVPDALKETIGDVGQAGFATRIGQQADDILSGPAAQQAQEQAGILTDRSAFTADTITPAEAQEIEKEKLYSFDPTKRKAQKGEFAQKRANDIGVAPEEVAAQTESYGMNPVTTGSKENIDGVPAYQVAATRQAKTGQAAQRIAQELGDTPSLDLEGREAITGTAPVGTAAEIGGIPTMKAAEMQAVQGGTRTMAAADMLGVTADIPPDITAAISEDPAVVTAAIDNNKDPQVTAAVAALPEEALVSVQMENLLAGMEEGKTPTWARPAVDAVEQMMASRGLSASSVGRDALFNAIIQSALPMAQSNAQALQQRAQQNLSNEQQAVLAESQQIMQVRMQNLANTQTAASQTAQMAQQIRVQQSTFNQQAVMATAQQGQETRMADVQMEQQRAQQESAQRQQAAVQTLSAEAQMDLANLQAQSTRAGKQLDADQQARLSTYNAQITKVMRQAELAQDMEKANLSPALQVEMQRISEINAADKDSMTAEQQERLTQFQTLIDFRKTDAQFAQQMDMANMSNEQQIRLAELQDKIATDSANVTEANKFELQRLNNIVNISVRQSELNQDMEKANLDTRLRTELTVLSEKGTTARADMSSEQQMRLANLQNLVDYKKTNVAMAQQMDLSEMSNEQQIRMAELADKIATDTVNVSTLNQLEFAKLQTYAKFMSENAGIRQQTELANFSNAEKFSLADLASRNQASSENLTVSQQTELANLEARLKVGALNAQQRQQVITQTFSLEQQTELSNLEARNRADSESLSNEQQAKLASYNAKVQTTIRQTELNNRMEEVNLDSRLKIELSSLSEKNATSRANMTSDQQMRLRRIETLVDFKKTNAQLAQQMDMANMSNEQQIEMAELADKAATNSANFSEANRFKLTQLQTSAQFMAQNTEFRQQTELANFSGAERIQLANLQALNQASSENLTVSQQTELANLNSKLTVGIKNAELKQQAISQTFSADQQIELANLEALNRADADSMSADQQSKLASYTAKVQRTIRQTELNQDMEKANLDVRLKSELSVLSEKNATERANMSADQQMRLANLSTLVDFKKTDVAMAQQMDMANMGNEQQMELANLAERSSTDAANMTAENNRRLSDLQTYASVMSENAQLAQQSDLANLSMEEKIRLVNLTEANRADSESMSSENVAELQMFEKKMAAGQVNAQLAQQMGLANLSNQQAAAMFNAQVNADLDMTQFNFEQQTELANSKFLQTMTATDLNNRQQAVMQDATTLAAMDMQAADTLTKVSIENARNFLQMDMANLSNEQQAAVLDQQLSQQRILSNQSAENASRQFNANSENQVNQFMANLGADMAKFNAVQINTMEQFNVSEKNRIAALDTNNQIEVNKINATISSDISRFNASLEDSREKWNAANAQAVEQSNVEWRRHANTIDTAAQNAANATNIANAFGLSSRDSAFLWQELRDNMNKDFSRELTQQERQVAIVNSALQSESFLTDPKYETERAKLFAFMGRLVGFDLSSTGFAATGEGNTTTQEDAGSVGNTVEVNTSKED